jgi:hypothetical protein
LIDTLRTFIVKSLINTQWIEVVRILRFRRLVCIQKMHVFLKGTQAVRIEFVVYNKSCQYSMFYTNKML